MQEIIKEVTKEADRVAKKQKTSSAKATATLTALITEIQTARAQVGSTDDPGRRAEAFKDFQTRVAQKLADVTETQAAGRELNAVVARLGKSIDRPFGQEVERAWFNKPVDNVALDTVVMQHLLRQGHFGIAEKFAESSGVEVDEESKEAFLNMHNIVGELRIRNVEPALAWASSRRADGAPGQAEAQASTSDLEFLEFDLHVLKFLSLLQKEGRAAAVAYARGTFPHFANTPTQLAEIQRLMGCLLYADRLADSPYKARCSVRASPHWISAAPNPQTDLHEDLVSADRWDAAVQSFMRAFCSAVGRASDSLLAVSLHAGAKALPSLIKLSTLVAAQKAQAWDSLEQLPVEIELGREFVFRSVFACPVAREQSTPDNPPTILPCGHVLCRGTIQKLAKGNSRMFKCPYCPIEVSVNQCREIYF